MTLPLNGLMSSEMINVELGREAGAPFSLGGDYERALAGRASGLISFSDFYGKRMREPFEGEYWQITIYEWAFAQSAHIRWNGGWITGINAGLTQFDHDGWRYHRGNYKTYTSIYGIHVWHNFYGVWRERL